MTNSDENWKWHAAVACREIGGETVIVGTDKREVHITDEVGTFLWQHLKHGATIAKLTELLCADYDVSEGRACQDVKEFVDELVAKQLLENIDE